MTMPPQQPQQNRRRRRPRPRQDTQLGPVVITQREMYDLLVEVHDTVADLAADLTGHAKDVGELKTTVAKQDERIGRLEKFRWVALGVAAAGGGAIWRIGEVLFAGGG